MPIIQLTLKILTIDIWPYVGRAFCETSFLSVVLLLKVFGLHLSNKSRNFINYQIIDTASQSENNNQYQIISLHVLGFKYS